MDAGACGMTGLPVASYLNELDAGSEWAHGPRALPGRAAGSGKPSADVEARINEAYARGLSEGQAAARSELDARLKEQAAAVETRLAAERRAWVAGECEQIAAALAAGLSDIEERIASRVARVLKPVIAGHVQRRAVEELVQTLEALLTKGDIGRITVSGPEDLLGALRCSLEGKASNVTFAPAATADLRIEADETVLETRIAAWAAAIGGEAS
jgi:hypothetical protein